MESKYRFKSGVNLVDSEKASHAQLALLAPDGTNVFTEIGRCEDGTAIFVLSKEMIDELSEVGLYSFQVRLFDYYRESRITIPPIEFGIEVREPIAAEDHSNAVDQAMVGYSIAKTSVLDEPVPPTFNANDDYNKTNWKTGDRISEGKLNKLEDAVDKINQNVKNNDAAINKRVASNFNVLDTTKADIDYVDNQVAALASGSPKGVYASLSALQSAIPNGNSNLYITSDNGHWNFWNGSKWVSGGVYQSTGLSDNSVDTQHIRNGVVNTNLFDASKVILNAYVNTAQTIIQVNGTAYAKIPVEAENTYIMGRKFGPNSIDGGDPFMFLDSSDNMLFFGRSGNYLAGTDADGIEYMKVTAPEGAAYFCFNLWVNSFDSREKAYCYNVNDIPANFTSLAECEELEKIFGINMADINGRGKLQALKDSIKNISRDIYAQNVRLYYDTYVDLNGTMNTAKGWVRAEIDVEPNTKYSLYFPSQTYSSARGHCTFRNKTNTQLAHYDFDNESMFRYGQLENGEHFREFVTPNDCVMISFSAAAGESQNYSYDDSNTTIITEGSMDIGDIRSFVKSIDGVPVFTPDKINDYVILPEFESTWGDDNLLHHPDAMYRNNTLYNSNGKRQSAMGWGAIDVPVEGGKTYYFYSDSCKTSTRMYASGGRGHMLLLDANHETIQPIVNQETSTVMMSNGYWQVIETTPETRYVGITILNVNNDYDDRYTGMMYENIPEPELFTPYITKINHWEIKAANTPVITTSGQYNTLYTASVMHSNTLYNNNENGQKQTAAGWMAADVTVQGGKTYYFYSPSEEYGTGIRGRICLLNGSGYIIRPITGQTTNVFVTNNSRKWQIIETTSDTAAIGITIVNPNGNYDDRQGAVLIDREPTDADAIDMVVAINGLPISGLTTTADYAHPLQGKKWVVIGDSLTEFNRRATKNYHHWIAEETGVIVHNMGVSGTGYMRQQENNRAFYQRVVNIPKDADIITIFGSGNDLSLPLGTPTDKGEDTICGCMHLTIQNIFQQIPGAKLGIVLPCPWGSVPPHQKGNKMELYSAALKEVAMQYSIPVLDLYYGSNLRPWDPTFRDLYYKWDEGGSVHPDEDGHKILANKFKMFIQSL